MNGKKTKKKTIEQSSISKDCARSRPSSCVYGTALEKTSEEGMKDRSVTDVGYIDLKIACLSLCTE